MTRDEPNDRAELTSLFAFLERMARKLEENAESRAQLEEQIDRAESTGREPHPGWIEEARALQLELDRDELRIRRWVERRAAEDEAWDAWIESDRDEGGGS